MVLVYRAQRILVYSAQTKNISVQCKRILVYRAQHSMLVFRHKEY